MQNGPFQNNVYYITGLDAVMCKHHFTVVTCYKQSI